MSINFATLQGLTIPEGVVTQITDAAGNVLWSANQETSILYLRPSADISINHSLYPADSTAAYLLIGEEEPDGASTYISHTFVADDTSTYSKSSSFRFSCANLPQTYRIKSAKIIYINYSVLGYAATLTNYRVTATISVDGSETKIYVTSTYNPDGDYYADGCYADITDIIKNKSLSSNITVTLTQECDDCETYTYTGDNKGNIDYTTAEKRITTAWIEVEYI